MSERRYQIGRGLLGRLIENSKVLSMMYHTMARVKLFGAGRFRAWADRTDADAEEAKQEMRKQDRQE